MVNTDCRIHIAGYGRRIHNAGYNIQQMIRTDHKGHRTQDPRFTIQDGDDLHIWSAGYSMPDRG